MIYRNIKYDSIELMITHLIIHTNVYLKLTRGKHIVGDTNKSAYTLAVST